MATMLRCYFSLVNAFSTYASGKQTGLMQLVLGSTPSIT